MQIRPCWVLWWTYGSDDGQINIVRCYDNPERAKQDYALVEDDTVRKFKLTEVSMFS